MQVILGKAEKNNIEYNIVFYFDTGFDQVWIQIVDPQTDKIQQGWPESDPEYRIKSKFGGDVDAWLAEEFIPEINEKLKAYFGKEVAPEIPTEWRERIKYLFTNNVVFDEQTSTLKFDKPAE